MAFAFIQQALTERKAQDLYRQRFVVESGAGALIEVAGKPYLNFSSNDYLGLKTAEPVLQGWIDGISQYGSGSGASPLVTGYTQAHAELEAYLAKALGRDKVLLFNAGFAANMALCQTLAPKGVTLLADRLSHASLIDGATACEGQLKRFKHNDLNHLYTLLEQTDGDTLIATEGVFSMDGDQAPLAQMAALAEQHQAWLMLDDAHGFGVLGKSGMGSIETFGLSQSQLPVLMGTFGKAVGTAGAFVAGSAELIDYLINCARHYVYSTAFPPAQATATLASIKLLQSGQLQAKLQANIALFTQLAAAQQLPISLSKTAIQPLIIGDSQTALKASEYLKQLGLWVSAIRYPTVPKGSARLRICLSASLTEQDIQALVDGLVLAADKGLIARC